MIYEIDKYTEFLCNYKITANQFYICWLLYTKDYTNLKKYVATFGKFEEDEIKDLIERDFLVNTNPKATAYNVQCLFVTVDFADKIIIEPDDAFDELMEHYPKFVVVNGNKYPATGLNWQDEKGLREAYGKEIKKNKFLHNTVIELLKEWKEQNGGYALFKIDKFITSKYWKELKQAKENHVRPRIY